MRSIFNDKLCCVGAKVTKRPSSAPRNRFLLPEHLSHGVAHVRHHLDGADLVPFELDAVLRGNLDDLAGRLNAMPAVGAGEDTAERHRHLVGDDEAVLGRVLRDVHDLDLPAEIGEGGALAPDLPQKLGESHVRHGFTEAGSEPGDDELLSPRRFTLEQGLQEGPVVGFS
jgi:hypothetical protein